MQVKSPSKIQRTKIFFGLTTGVKCNQKWRFSVESLEALETLFLAHSCFQTRRSFFKTNMFT